MKDDATGCDAAHDEAWSVSDSMMVEVLNAFSAIGNGNKEDVSDVQNSGEQA